MRDLLDNAQRQLAALEALKIKSYTWDPLLVFLIVGKLDDESRRHWELSLTTSELPELNGLFKFMLTRCLALESIVVEKPKLKTKTFSVTTSACAFCNESHFVGNCARFKNINSHERYNVAKKKSLCFNCLKGDHSISECRSSSCSKCNKKHHLLLHFDFRSDKSSKAAVQKGADQTSSTSSLPPEKPVVEPNAAGDSKTVTLQSCTPFSKQSLLLTMLVNIRNKFGQIVTARAILDPGSQSNLITSSFARTLQLPFKPIEMKVDGVGQNSEAVTRFVDLEISSIYNSHLITLEHSQFSPKT